MYYYHIFNYILISFPCFHHFRVFQSLRNRIEAIERQLDAGWGSILEKPDRKNGVNSHEKVQLSKNEKLIENQSENVENNLITKKLKIIQDKKYIFEEKNNNFDHIENNYERIDDVSDSSFEPNNKDRKGRYGKKMKKEDTNDSLRPGKRGKTSFQFDGETVNLMHFKFIIYIYYLLLYLLFTFIHI